MVGGDKIFWIYKSNVKVFVGRIGLVMDMAFYYPHSDSEESLQAQENALQFTVLRHFQFLSKILTNY